MLYWNRLTGWNGFMETTHCLPSWMPHMNAQCGPYPGANRAFHKSCCNTSLGRKREYLNVRKSSNLKHTGFQHFGHAIPESLRIPHSFDQTASLNAMTSKIGGRATNHFGGLDVAPGCHCRVQWTWCHCWVPGRVTTNFQGVDVVPLLGAILVCYGWGGDDQLWGSGRGGRRYTVLYIDNTKIVFCYLGSMLV